MKTYFENKIAELRTKIQNSDNADEIRSYGAEIEEMQKQLAKVNADEQKRSFNPVATFSQGGANKTEDPEMRSRLDFANYVTRGVMTPEMRATTNTTNTAPAIPSNLVSRIIENIEATGMILPLVTRTAYPVGQSIPVDSTKPTATWVTEGNGSTVQAKSTLGSIVFGAFKLRCEIRMTHEVTVKTISAFETLFVKQVSEAMVKAIESKIVSADAGTANPTGILYDAKGTDKHVDVAKGTTGKLTYKLLCDAEAEIPQQKEAGAKWFMSKKTFMQFVGMQDTNGQPVARVNYGIGGKPERTLLGRDVVLTGAYLPDYTEATASADVTFAFLFDPSEYVLNTSYDLGIQRKQDWDNEDHCIKAVMSVDGKVLDRTSLVKLVKKTV
jgi:HK97 family phage major capsid protein